MAAPAEARVIVVTGCTRGLGRALVSEFAAAGHTVAGCGRSRDGIAAVSAELGTPHVFSVVDVADDAAVAVWARDVIRRLGAPELLVNNAGLINDPAPLWEVDAGSFDRILAVNLSGVANCIRHFVPAMVARKRGVIVNLSSGWGRSVSPGVGPYCATKWGIEGLTKTLAEELPEGMAAVPLNPGAIDTDMLRQCWSDRAANFPKAKEWGRSASQFILRLGPRDNGRSVSVP